MRLTKKVEDKVVFHVCDKTCLACKGGFMTQREELLSVPKRKWDDELHGVNAVYIIPSRRKHDSGYACMDFVASFNGNKKKSSVRFGGGCDDVRLNGNHFRIDCEYPSRIIRIWNDKTSFSISHDLSSIDFVEEST